MVLSSQTTDMKDALATVGKDKAQAANPLVQNGQKLIPSVTRVFNKNRDMFVYVQAYERKTESQRPLTAFVAFYKDGEKSFEMPFTVSDGMHPKSKAVPLKLTVPLASLAAGQYVCQLTIVDPGDQKVAFWQGLVKIVS